jgi:chromosome segregation ATPase
LQALKDQQASAEQTAALRQQLLAARRQTELNAEEMQRAFAALKTNFTSNVKLLRQSILQQEKEFQRAAQNEQREAHRATMAGVEESEKRTRAGLTALEQVLRAETTQRLHAHETLQRWKDEVNAQLRDSKHDSVRVMSDKVHEVETALVALQSSLSQTLDSQVDRQTKVSHALVAEVAELRAYTHAAKDALQKKYKAHKADVSAALQQAESRLAAQVTSKGEQLDKQLLEGVQSLDQRLEATIAELRDERVQLGETQKAHALEVDNKQTAATQQLRAYLAENDRNLHQQLEAHTQALRTEAGEAEQRHIASIHEVELRVTGSCDRAVAQLKSSTGADTAAAETRAKEREAQLQKEMDTRTTTQDQALRALQSTCDERHSATLNSLQQHATSMQELDLRLQNRIESTQSSLSSALDAAKQQLNASILEVGAQNDSQVALVRQAVLACVERVDALEAKIPTIDTSIAELGERATKLGEANKESEEKALQAVAALRSAVDADKLAESARLDRLAAAMEEQKAAHISSEQAAAERDQSHKTQLDEVKATAEKNGVEIASLRTALDSVTKEIAQGREATDNCDKSIADLKSASSKCDIEISELKTHQERTAADVTELRGKLTEAAAAASKPSEVDPVASANAAKLTELVDRTDAIDKTLTDIVLQSSRQRDTVQELSSKVAQLEKQRVASPVPPQAVEAPKQAAPQPEAPKEAPPAANSPQKAPADGAADNYEDNYE